MTRLKTIKGRHHCRTCGKQWPCCDCDDTRKEHKEHIKRLKNERARKRASAEREAAELQSKLERTKKPWKRAEITAAIEQLQRIIDKNRERQ